MSWHYGPFRHILDTILITMTWNGVFSKNEKASLFYMMAKLWYCRVIWCWKSTKMWHKCYFWILLRLGDKLVELVIFRHYFTLLDNQKWWKTRVIAAFSLKICATCKFGINICDTISNWRDHSLVCHQMVHTLQSLTCKSLASKLARPLCYAIKRAICYTLYMPNF
jgi:hypothetical protein